MKQTIEIIRYRSAITGKFVSEEFAKANPDTTIKQTMEVQPKND